MLIDGHTKLKATDLVTRSVIITHDEFCCSFTPSTKKRMNYCALRNFFIYLFFVFFVFVFLPSDILFPFVFSCLGEVLVFTHFGTTLV